MLKVQWPGINVNRVEIWKVLELSGMAQTSRKATLFLKAGYVYLNNNLVLSLKDTVEVGNPFILSLRFPTGLTKENEIVVVNRMYYEQTPQRRGDLDGS